jgi:hypothetical protein
MVHPEEPNTVLTALKIWSTGGTIIVAIALGIPAIFFALIILESFAMRAAH